MINKQHKEYKIPKGNIAMKNKIASYKPGAAGYKNGHNIAP